MSTITLNPDDLAATRSNLGLGTAAVLNTGTANGNVPVVGSDGKLPSAVMSASGGSIDLTASGAVTAGKTLVLNANGTVSQIAATTVTEVVGSSYTPSNETATETGFLAYSTVADKFLSIGRSTISGSNQVRYSILDLSNSMGITETVAPTSGPGVAAIYSVTYSAVHDRFLAHYQNGSPYYPSVNTISYSSSDGLSTDGVTNVSGSNRPYGSSIFAGSNDATIVSLYNTTTSPSSGFVRFLALTTGSQANGDSMASDGENNSNITTGGESHRYYSTPIYFPTEDKLILLTHAYHGNNNDYRPRLAYGSITGSGGSATFSEDGEDNWSDSDRFDYQGGTVYASGINRAVWFDGKFMRTLGMAGGYAKSSLQTIQSAYPTNAGHDSVGIPGTNKVVLFTGDNANSSRLSYWVVTVTTGTQASGDSFAVDGPHEISTDVVYHGLGAAYSPDVDGFLVRVRINGAASKTYGVRVTRTSTNVTTTNFVGFAGNSASDGGTVTVQLPSAIATPTQGSLVVGTTYYVKNDGTIGTNNEGLGIAGRATSSTKLIVEERA